MPTRTALLILFLGLLFLGGTISLSVPATASTVTVKSTNEVVTLKINILNATYMDADGDGFVDDVVGYFDILLDGSQRYNLNVYPSLTLPSGYEYDYAYIVNTKLSVLHCVMYFFDHAMESGNYTFTVQIVSFTGGVAIGSVNYVFDPPGGSGDADPAGKLEVIA